MNGPRIRDEVRAKTDAYGVHYAYVDHVGRVVPAWSAVHVRITAYYAEMGRSMDELAAAIAELPDCVVVGQLPGDDTKRPRVVAYFGEREMG